MKQGIHFHCNHSNKEFHLSHDPSPQRELYNKLLKHTHLTNGIITSEISWICSRKVWRLQAAELFIAIAVDARTVGAWYEVAEIVRHFGCDVLRLRLWLISLAFGSRDAWRRREIERVFVPIESSRCELLLIIVERFWFLISHVKFIVKIIRRMMCFLSHILKNVRLYSSIAHNRLLLGEKLILYPKIKVVSVLFPQELEQLHGEYEWASLAVEHGRTPRLPAKHSTDRHAGLFGELKKGILAAVSCMRNEFAQGEAVLHRDLDKTEN